MTQSKSPADTMAVAQRGPAKPTVPASLVEKEVKFLAFASDLEIRLTIKMVIDFICIPTKSGHKCTEAEALKFMMMCQARRLNPWEGDAFLQGYDGKNGPVFSLITAHQAFLKRAEASEPYDGMQSGVLVRLRGEPDEKGNTVAVGDVLELEGDFYLRQTHTLVGAWARVHSKTRKFPVYRRLDIEVFDQQFGRWEKDPAGMMTKCAESDALRSAFPSVLGGLYLAQELDLKEKTVTPTPKINAPSFITQPPSLPPPTPPPQPEPAKQIDDTEAKAAEPERLTASAMKALDAAEQEDPLADPKDVTEGLEGKQVIDLLFDLMKKDGVNEDQVLAHLRTTKLAKPNQVELAQLADSKLRTLANAWARELPAIKAIQI